MFGLDSNTLAFIALAGFSGAALVYALLFQKIEEENRTGKRLKSIQAADTDKSTARTLRDKATDANKRRKAVQDNLKDLEERLQAWRTEVNARLPEKNVP